MAKSESKKMGKSNCVKYKDDIENKKIPRKIGG